MPQDATPLARVIAFLAARALDPRLTAEERDVAAQAAVDARVVEEGYLRHEERVGELLAANTREVLAHRETRQAFAELRRHAQSHGFVPPATGGGGGVPG